MIFNTTSLQCHIEHMKRIPITSQHVLHVIYTRDLRSFMIRFDFESYVRFEIRFVLMARFEIFESSALSIVIRKETIGVG